MELKNKFKGHFIFLIVVSVIFLIGMLFATFFDFQISQFLVDLKEGKYLSENLFGRFFEAVGPVPIYFLAAFSCVVICQNFIRREKQKSRNIIVILTVIMSAVILAFMFKKTFGTIANHLGFEHKLGGFWDYIAYVIFGVALTFGLIILTKKFSNSFLNKTLCFAVIVILTAGLSEGITHLLKHFLYRARYRTMNAISDFELYRPWYDFLNKITPNEIMAAQGVASDAFKSFPSGHSSAIAILVVLTALPKYIPSLNTSIRKFILYSIVGAVVLAGMYARILVGAHYLSDVLVGAYITILCYVLITIVITKVFEKYVKLVPLREKVKIIRLEEENV